MPLIIMSISKMHEQQSLSVTSIPIIILLLWQGFELDPTYTLGTFTISLTETSMDTFITRLVQ